MRIDIEEIKARVTIEDILADEGIILRNGRCRCPLHNGDNPTSFAVKNGTFHCFACGESSDVIGLVEKLYGLSFREAIKYLTKRSGISTQTDIIPKREFSQQVSLRIFERDYERSVDDGIDFLEEIYIKMLRQLDNDLKARKISLSDFYAKRQLIEYRLEDLDEFSILRNYKMNMRRKEIWKEKC